MDTELSVILADFAGQEVQAVSSRMLYEFLWLTKSNYSKWIEKTIKGQGTEWVDYILWWVLEYESIDYTLTIDFAKTVSMMSNSKKGKEVRAYFLNVEKAYKEKVHKPLSQLEIIAQSAQILLEQDKRVTQLENKVLQIEAQQKTINTDYYTISGYCHIKGKSVPITQASLLGRKCSKLSKELEYEVSSTYDARYGTVNLYHIDILSQIIK